MKTLVPFFSALFLLTANSLFAQVGKTFFENAALAKSNDGKLCMNLAWKKGEEKAAYYLVQRSVDSVEFKTVGLVFTSEDSSFCNYKFKDKGFASSGNGAVYYRIVIVSDQKELTYLPVRKVETALGNVSFGSGFSDTLLSKN